jgi:heme o synthase
VPNISISPSCAVAEVAPAAKATSTELVRALIVLTKPRLAFFSVLTAMAGYGVSRTSHDLGQAVLTCLGTACAAGGALSLNHWWERDTDGLMKRTKSRPLPRRAVSAGTALAWSLLLSAVGVLSLAMCTHVAAGAFALATILLYGVIYTPLKRRSRWATEVGSISGALPPLLGAAAAGNVYSGPAWTLALVLVLWQMPHFFAIGWMHRADYRAAGFPLLPAQDATGARTSWWSFGYTAALVAVSIVPWALGWVGALYGFGAVGAGIWFAWKAWHFVRATGDRHGAARDLFRASIIYLPAIMAALVFDQLV